MMCLLRRYFAAKERGFFLDQCLDVSIIDGNGVFGGINITAADSDFGIPWFLQFLELVDGGSPYIHISQVGIAPLAYGLQSATPL